MFIDKVAEGLKDRFPKKVFGVLFDPETMEGCIHMRPGEKAELFIGEDVTLGQIDADPRLGFGFSVEYIETGAGCYIEIEASDNLYAAFSITIKDGIAAIVFTGA